MCVTIPNIKVTSGKCEIGFFSNGDAKAFTMVDDVAFYESTGYGARVAEVLKSAGGFDDNYARMAQHYNQRIEALAHPVTLPVPGLANMYKSIQIMVWDCMVKSGDDYEIRAGAKTPAPSACTAMTGRFPMMFPITRTSSCARVITRRPRTS